ncbi:MAG: TolC family protein [Deltaproteobacteria bacterium]|nr:TolC family protein [Deltaproteobacteria bacterium]
MLCSKYAFTTCLILLGASLPAFGEKPLTIDEAVAEALGENPKLKSEKAQVDAYQARIGVAKSLDDPMVGVEFYDVPMNTTDPTKGNEINYSFVQKIPFPGKLATQGKMAQNLYQAQRSTYDAKMLETQVNTEHAYHDLYFIDGSLRINKELQALWRKLVASEEGRYTTSAKSSRNFLKTKVELDKLQSEGALLEAKRIRDQATLNILRHKNPGDPILLAELPTHEHPYPTYEEFEKIVFEKHPELKVAQHLAEASKNNASLAKRQTALPDLELRGTYVQRFGQIDAWTTEARINIPFLWGKTRKQLKEAKAMSRASEQEYISVKDERLADLKQSYAQLESAKKSYALYRTKILPYSTMSLKSSEAAYETGTIDFINFIDSAREFKEAKQGGLEAFVEYQKAITHLKEAAGEDFMAALMQNNHTEEK